MRALLVLICLSVTACESGVTNVAMSDGGRKQIDCADSYLVLGSPGKYQCEQFARTNSSSGDRAYGGIFQKFNIFGTLDDGTGLSLQAAKALNGGHYNPNINPNFSYESTIQGIDNTVVKQAKNWSAARTVDGARVMDFTDARQRQCFGFAEFGGVVREGYDHLVSGFYCRKSPAFTDEQIAKLLSQVFVRASLSSPLPAAMLPKPLLTCEMGSTSSFETANEAGCLKMGGHIRPL